ncbi:MAG: hypothetical protein AAF677_05390 [Pseudomonadota bacterium]
MSVIAQARRFVNAAPVTALGDAAGLAGIVLIVAAGFLAPAVL